MNDIQEYLMKFFSQVVAEIIKKALKLEFCNSELEGILYFEPMARIHYSADNNRLAF